MYNSTKNTTYTKRQMPARLLFCVVLLISVESTVGQLAPGSLDPSFSGDGKVTTLLQEKSGDFGLAVAIQPDGKIVTAGASYNSNRAAALVRYNIDGALDTSFGIGGRVITPDVRAFAIAIQPDGKIVAAGDYGSPAAVFRYNSDGSLDTTFDGDGIASVSFYNNDIAYAVAVQPNGKIVIAGYGEGPFFAPEYHTTDFALARLNTDGSLDTSFGVGGKVITPISSGEIANAVAIQPDGKILAAGWTTDVNGGFALVRYNTNGSLDTSFGGDGIIVTGFGGEDTYGRAEAFALQQDSKIVATGSYDASGTDFGFAIVRYNTDGSLDTTFGKGGVVTIANPVSCSFYGVTIQPNGRIIAAGGNSYDFNPMTNNDFAVFRLNANGSPDTSFGVDGKVTTDFFGFHDSAKGGVALQTDGKIVVAGFGYNGSDYDFAVARYIGDAVAVNVSVSGRVTTPDGRGLRNAVVSITDSQGVHQTAVTSTFGYYSLENVRSGETYTIQVSSRRYRFQPRVVEVVDNLTDADFVGIE